MLNIFVRMCCSGVEYETDDKCICICIEMYMYIMFNNVIETWKILRTVMGKNLQKSNNPDHFITEGNKVENKRDNKHFQ